MKELYRKYKREICIGVVVSLITTAILKFGDWLVMTAPTIGVTLFETVSNVVYSLAAMHTDNLLLRIMLYGSFGFLVGGLAKIIIEGVKLYKTTLLLEKKCKKFTNIELENILQETFEEENDKSETEKQNSFFKIIQNGKKIGRASIMLVVIITLIYIFLTLFVTRPMSLCNKFEQDIIKITPYIDSREISQLKSEWVCMRSKAEYDKIYERIDQVIENYDLPK